MLGPAFVLPEYRVNPAFLLKASMQAKNFFPKGCEFPDILGVNISRLGPGLIVNNIMPRKAQNTHEQATPHIDYR